MSIKSLIYELIGMREDLCEKQICAYRLRLDLLTEKGIDISKESEICRECSGYPSEKGCVSYCDLDHIIDFHRKFRNYTL